MPIQLPASSPATTDLVALGECSLDTLVEMAGHPRPDEKHRVTHRAELPGGQAATAALCVRRLGWRSRFVGAVGDDAVAHLALHHLVTAGVDVRVRVCGGARTRTAVILVETGTGVRTVLEDREPALRFGETDPDPADVVTGRILLVDLTDPGAAARAATTARRAGVPVMIDADTAVPALDELLGLSDIAVLTGALLKNVGGSDDLAAACRHVARRTGAPVIVATMGAEGSLALAADQLIRTPSVSVNVTDTTGAGDAFRGGFAAGWLEGGPGAVLEDVLAFANAVAAANCLGLGAQEALPVRAALGGRFNPDVA